MDRRFAHTSRPTVKTRPAEGFCFPSTQAMAAALPAPLCPISAWIEPDWIESETASQADSPTRADRRSRTRTLSEKIAVILTSVGGRSGSLSSRPDRRAGAARRGLFDRKCRDHFRVLPEVVPAQAL